MWEKIHLDLKEIGENQTRTMYFVYLGNPSHIKSFLPKCMSCTKIKSFKDGVLKVVFKANKIPQHLKVSTYTVTKKILVKTTRGEEELSFSITIKK